MRVLQVIHGYTPRYNAGSEVYTQTLAHGLADRHEVRVFTREENPYAPDYALREEPDAEDPRVGLTVVNLPRTRDQYRDQALGALRACAARVPGSIFCQYEVPFCHMKMGLLNEARTQAAKLLRIHPGFRVDESGTAKSNRAGGGNEFYTGHLRAAGLPRSCPRMPSRRPDSRWGGTPNSNWAATARSVGV